MLNRSKLYAAVLLAAVFIAGAVVGGATQAAWGDRDGRESRDGRRRHGYVDRLARELDLSTTQRDRVASVLEESSVAMEMLWTEIRPRMDSLRTEIRAKIADILTPDQQGQYRALNARSDSARAARARGSRHDR